MEKTEGRCTNCSHCTQCHHQQRKHRVNQALIVVMFLICVTISLYQSALCIRRYLDNPITVRVTEPDAQPSNYPLILVCGPNIREIPAVNGQFTQNQFSMLFNRLMMINLSWMENYPWEDVPLQTYYDSLKPNIVFFKVTNLEFINGTEVSLKPVYTAINGLCFYTDELQTIDNPTFVNMGTSQSYTMSIISKWDLTQIYPNLINEWNILYGKNGQLKTRYLDIKKKTRVEAKDHRCEPSDQYNQIKCLETCIVTKVAEKYGLKCTLPWLKDILDLPICNNYLDYKKLIETLRYIHVGEDFMKPCKADCPERCTKLYYSITGDDEDGYYQRSFFILKLKSTISEVKEFAAYEFTNLMGDIGGIIGILLGFSALGVFKELVTYLIKKQSNIPI